MELWFKAMLIDVVQGDIHQNELIKKGICIETTTCLRIKSLNYSTLSVSMATAFSCMFFGVFQKGAPDLHYCGGGEHFGMP